MIFLVGGFAASANVLVVNSFSTPIVLYYAEVIASIALVLAAPVCFCLATFGTGGDRWTLRYSMAWVALIAAYCVVGLIASVT